MVALISVLLNVITLTTLNSSSDDQAVGLMTFLFWWAFDEKDYQF